MTALLRLEELETRLTPSNLLTLASFDGTDGGGAKAAVIMDKEGNLYGTTQQGGSDGDGNVFEVAKGSGTVTNLASFTGAGGNGQEPVAGLSIDASGNLYGTTFGSPYGDGANGYGTVYELERNSGTITTLASFNVTDGANPEGNPIFDSSGNLYGTTAYGGPDDIGTVFKLSPTTGTITTLAWFNGADGSYPRDSLLMDSNGNLYGTTKTGGPDNDGTVFKVVKGSGAVTTLADFNGTNGSLTPGGLVMDASGNLYGVAENGGADNDGTVYEVVKGSGIATVLASFDSTDGANPGYETLVMDSKGNLYGTTLNGGAENDGTVFEVAKNSRTITTLVSFSGGDGATPGSGLIVDGSGNLYSTAVNLGAGNNGTVFELQPATNTSVASSANPSYYGQTVTLKATVTANAPATTTPTGTITFCSAGPQLSDPGFELPTLSPGTFQSNPSGSPWTFNDGSGVASNGSGFSSANPNAPQGNQVAFLQGGSADISQTVTFQAGTYVINFDAAQRGSNPVPPSDQTFDVTIDGKVISSFNSLLGTEYTNLTTSPFQVTAGSHTIAFVGTDLNGGDNTVLLDQVNVLQQLGTGKLNSSGQASFSTSTLPVGQNLITAIYSGSTNFPSSMGVVNQTILPVYVVTKTADDGSVGTLRDGITQANALGGAMAIEFNIGAVGTSQQINLLSPLPALTDNSVYINGLSQGGSGNSVPLITLSGVGVGSNADGLLLQGSNCTVSGLFLENFSANGIEVDGSNNKIGGTTAGSGNIVSGNAGNGILIDSGVTGTSVQGNFIGTDSTGNVAQGNTGNGIEAMGMNNTIGGTTIGARNVISGNGVDGVDITGSDAAGNVVEGNYIGTSAAGTAALANSGDGITLNSASVNSILNNTISGNGSDGVNITGNGALPGALAWYQADGNANDSVGVNNGTLEGGATANGPDATGGAGNSFSLNGSTGYVQAPNTPLWGYGTNDFSITLWVNFNAVPSSSLANPGDVFIGEDNGSGSQDKWFFALGGGVLNFHINNTSDVDQFINQVPFTPTLHQWYNLAVTRSADTFTIYVNGVALGSQTNTTPIPTGITAPLTIGQAEGAGYVNGNIDEVAVYNRAVSGQEIQNIYNLRGADQGGATIQGNFIGANAAGTAALANGGNGIAITNSSGNTIGGTTAAARNIIGGNSGEGIAITGSGTSGNLVEGNYIGTDKTGALAVANSVGIEDAGSGDTLGGSVSGAGNYISGNTGDGVLLDSTAKGEALLGNFIGLTGKGTAALANGGNGIEVQGTNNSIGGTAQFDRNYVSGNTKDGVLIDSAASGNVVLGDFIGSDTSGTHGVGNAANGVEVAGSSNTIGGTVSGATNIESGNAKDGIVLDSTASSNQVADNWVGTDKTGKVGVANSGNGVEVMGVGNTLGGVVGYARNIVSSNNGDGVVLDSGASGTLVQGNYIGVNYSAAALSNSGNGVNISSNNNSIGGTAGSAGNVISDNSKNGVLVSAGSGDTISRNSIFDNTGLGISLSSGANNNIAAPSISSASITGYALTVKGSFTAATANVPYVLEFFGNTSNDVEGKTFIGSLTVTPTSAGTQNFTFSTTTTVPRIYPLITATLTDNSGDTSQFSNGVSSTTIYVVNSTADSGTGTLRDAITQADNTTSGITTIDFAIGTSGSGQTISPVTALPTLTANNVFINGLSQGGLGNPKQLISLSGSGAGNSSDGLLLRGSNDVASGLIIEKFSKNGLEVDGTNNTIGGTTTGAGDILSGNTSDGLLIDSGVSGNQVLGNYIGVLANNTALGNSGNGIEIAGTGNTVGAAVSAGRNVISANAKDGVLIDSAASGNQVLGNFIGLDITGTKIVGNSANGVEVAGSSNTIGGTVSGAGNDLSGNSKDGLLLDSTASENLLVYNDIGTDKSGNVGLGNSSNGIEVLGNGNTVGGTSGYVRNIVSGNSGDGVRINSGASGNLLLGNYIGVNASSVALANSGSGVDVFGTKDAIGGTASGSRNIIAGNASGGMVFQSTASANLAQGNYIGLNAAGSAVGNSGDGILFLGSNNTIGGTTSAASNVISANSNDGVQFDSGASGNRVQGNYIGLNAGGTVAVANSIGIEDAGSGNTLGGTVSGARNVISGNSKDGILLDSAAKGEILQGNYIGLNAGGTAAVANSNGIEDGGTGNTVGGTASGARNYISGNSKDGILLDSSANGETIQSNYIGLAVGGTAAVANSIGIEDAGSGNTIGSSVSGAGNYISGNTGDGVLLDSSATGEAVQGNYIGLTGQGTAALANGSNGIEVLGVNNSIGGTAQFDRNYVSGNTKDGVLIDSAASGNVLQNNFIGLDSSGSHGVGNVTNGVEVAGSSNTIGGTISGATNYESGNKNDGILLDSTASSNLVADNWVGTDKTGKVGVANSGNGVEVMGAGNTLGGVAGYSRNIISGNGGDGVLLDSGASGTLVQGNYIGVNYSAATLGNSGNGVNIASNNNTIGGTTSGAGNVVSANGKIGVLVSAGSGTTISRNSIYANTGQGISLSSGANNNLAAPSLSSATLSGHTLTVKGSFTAATANVSYVLEFFANVSGDPEGRIYLGSLTATPTTTGTPSFTYTTTNSSQLGTYPLITATLTDNLGDTSAFSNGVTS